MFCVFGHRCPSVLEAGRVGSWVISSRWLSACCLAMTHGEVRRAVCNMHGRQEDARPLDEAGAWGHVLIKTRTLATTLVNNLIATGANEFLPESDLGQGPLVDLLLTETSLDFYEDVGSKVS